MTLHISSLLTATVSQCIAGGCVTRARSLIWITAKIVSVGSFEIRDINFIYTEIDTTIRAGRVSRINTINTRIIHAAATWT